MHRFRDDFNDEKTARLVALLTAPIFIKAQIAAYSDDFELPEHSNRVGLLMKNVKH